MKLVKLPNWNQHYDLARYVKVLQLLLDSILYLRNVPFDGLFLKIHQTKITSWFRKRKLLTYF